MIRPQERFVNLAVVKWSMPINYKKIPYKLDGFGVVGRKLEKYISDYNYNHANIDVDFYYNHPTQGPDKGRENRYSILYMPWESTMPRPGWLLKMSQYDEIWTPTTWEKGVVENWSFPVAQVYEHGMDSIWTPQKRNPEDKFIFLFQGFEALRKGATETIHAFNTAFRNNNNVELWIKTKVTDAPEFFPRIKYITGDLSLKDLVELYHKAHVMVSPTWGEGFGIPSRDALGTGMPLIHTGGFAPYEEYMHSDLIIDSRLVDSPWPKVHPGRMYKPDQEHLIEIMKKIYDNFTLYSEHSFKTAQSVHEHYDWQNLTNNAFFALEQRL